VALVTLSLLTQAGDDLSHQAQVVLLKHDPQLVCSEHPKNKRKNKKDKSN